MSHKIKNNTSSKFVFRIVMLHTCIRFTTPPQPSKKQKILSHSISNVYMDNFDKNISNSMYMLKIYQNSFDTKKKNICKKSHTHGMPTS